MDKKQLKNDLSDFFSPLPQIITAYLFGTMAENLLGKESDVDIASHIISRSGFREPRDNKDLFTILFENSIIGDLTCHSMIKMAKIRNIVVHDYAQIDPEIVIGILRKDFSDFKAFAKEIIGFLDQSS